ncbi:uncharacterized protein [Venturia canescens]|uniref:uncharacterized protein n=1 Tax=Venturia canescens TaxID=32260 RepID=UPI001C9CA8C4|nr:uncharacterized protein LOC122413341 [Venturia canescens]
MCHETTDWVETLPTVLLGLRTSVKEDIKMSAAELVYGTTLRLPGEFLVDYEGNDDHQIYAQRLRIFMRNIRPVPAVHHSRRKPFLHKSLYDCTHVFVKNNARKSLEQPFEGPYEVIKRVSDIVFKVAVNGQPTTISTERLKPVFFEAITLPDTFPVLPTSFHPVTPTPPTPVVSTPVVSPPTTTRIQIPATPPVLTPRPDLPPRTYSGPKKKKVTFTIAT